jgi:hypothetical protein
VEVVLDGAVARPEDPTQPPPVPDPESIERRRADADPAITVLPAVNVTMTSGATVYHAFEVPWP